MSEHAISVTLKGGKDFDSPWVVVYGDNPVDVEAKLDGIDGVLKMAASTAAAFRALHALEAGGVPVASVTTQPNPPAQQQPAGWGASASPAPSWAAGQSAPAAPAGPANGSPHPENRGCSGCGQVLQYKAFNSKAGKALKMWACPAQQRKGDGHDTIWVD